MKRKADSTTLPAESGKADLAAGSKKRKLSESEDFIPLGTTEKEARKKAKKDKKEKKEKDKAEKSEKSEKKEKSKDKKDKKEKKEKKDKKRKAEAEASEDVANEAEAQPAPTTAATVNGDSDEVAVKKSKKEKKDKKDKKDKSKKEKKTQESATEDADTKTAVKEAEAVDGTEDQQEQSGKREKYIVFIGNLPYSATADTIREHFASVKPTSVRLLTQRDNPSKSRGIAFMEFGTYGHMKSCLEHFHHSEFNDGVSPARKINVELTAGGGGKKEARQEKIKAKNKSLDEERAKRLAKEEAAKKEKDAEKGPPKPEAQEDMVHPSRRGQVPKGRR